MSRDLPKPMALIAFPTFGALLVAAILLMGAPVSLSIDKIVESPAVEIKAHPPLSKGSMATQEIVLDSIPGGGELEDAPICVSVMFATYAKTNHADIRVILEDHSGTKSWWQFNSSVLANNAYKSFCPRKGDFSEGGRITIESLSGAADDSPTFWMTKDTGLGELDESAAVSGDYGMRLMIERRAMNSPARFLGAGSGAYGLFLLLAALIALACMPMVLRSRNTRP